jgi:hypothetical protein
MLVPFCASRLLSQSDTYLEGEIPSEFSDSSNIGESSSAAMAAAAAATAATTKNTAHTQLCLGLYIVGRNFYCWDTS